MEQLYLRPLCAGDLADFYKLTANETVSRHMRFDRTATKESAAALLTQMLATPAFAIVLQDTFAGVFTLKPMADGAYAISTFLSPTHWGKGYSTQILKDRIAFAKKQLHATALFAYVVGENFGSRKVLEKLDFIVSEILELEDLPSDLYVYKLPL